MLMINENISSRILNNQMHSTSLTFRIRVHRSSIGSPMSSNAESHEQNVLQQSAQSVSQGESQQQRFQQPDLVQQKKVCLILIVKALLLIGTLLNLLLAVELYMLGWISALWMFIMIWSFDLIHMVCMLVMRGTIKLYLVGSMYSTSMFESLIIFGLQSSTFVYISVHKYKIHFVSIASMSYFIPMFFWMLHQKRVSKDVTMGAVLYQMFLMVMDVQFVMITLKWEVYQFWNWFQVFLIAWILLIFIFFIQVLQGFSMIEATVGYLRDRSLYTQLIGSIWMFALNFGVIMFPVIFLYSFCFSGVDIQMNAFIQMSCWLTCFYALLIFLFTLYSGKILIKFFGYHLFPNETRYAIPNTSQSAQTTFTSPSRINLRKAQLPFKFINLSSNFFKKSSVFENLSTKQISEKTVFSQSQYVKDKSMFDNEPAVSLNNIQVNNQKCSICYQNEANMVLEPCQHGGLCLECVESIVKQSQECPLCRCLITKVYQHDKEMGIVAVGNL